MAPPTMGSMTTGQFGGKLPFAGYLTDASVLSSVGFASLDDAGRALATGSVDTGPIPRCSPVPLIVNGMNFGQFDYVMRRGNFTLSTVTASDWFSAIQDTRAAFIVIDGSLTLEAGALLRPAVRKLFTCLYVSGDLVIDGTVSMTARGANHSGTDDSGGYVAASDIRILTGTCTLFPARNVFSAPVAAYAYYRLIVQAMYKSSLNLDGNVRINEFKLFTPTENGTMTSDSSIGYVVSASSTQGTSQTAAFRAFDKNLGNAWTSPNTTYSTTTGLYLGSVSTTVDGNSILGEWLQIQYGTAQTLERYSLTTGSTVFQMGGPYSYVLAGSNDGTTWSAVDTRPATIPSGGISEKMCYSSSYSLNITNPNVPAAGGLGSATSGVGVGCGGYPSDDYFGFLGGTGGGGQGGKGGTGVAPGGLGAAGTAFSGGSGGGGSIASLQGGAAGINGGIGGLSAPSGVSGGYTYTMNSPGAGNPTGGTGGTLIVICRGNVSGTGSMQSNGSVGVALSDGGSGSIGGGTSGAGSVTLMYGAAISGNVTLQASGEFRAQMVAGGDSRGGLGGNGSVRKIFSPALSLPNQSSIGACYSTRVAVTAYTGPLFRVRRSADDAQQDFYTDAVQSFMTTGAGGTGTAYAAWIGTSTAYVSIWYDQSGNANHATNAVNDATQPNIAIQSGKYIVQWKNANATVLTMGTAVSPKGMYCTFYNTNSSHGSIISRGDITDYQMRFGGTGISVNGGLSSRDWFYSSSGTKVSYVNGTSSTTVTLNTWNIMSLSVQTPGFSLRNIGMDGYSASRSINGYMTEMVMYTTAQLAGDMTTYYATNSTYGLNIIGSGVREYPPVPLSSDTSVIADVSYGNGTYVTTASSVYYADFLAWKAFDRKPIATNTNGSYWHSTGRYSTGGVALDTTAVVDGSGVAGEWLGIQLPSAIVLTAYGIMPRQEFLGRIPRNFTIAGSNDGITWTRIDTRTNQTGYVANALKAFTILPTPATAYQYFRIIVSNVNNAETTLQIGEWRLYGS